MSPFDQFPHIETAHVLLRATVPGDADDLFALYSREEVFRFIPGEARRHRDTVANMIGHFARDFGKKKQIYLAICTPDAPERMLGLAEMFDYDARVNCITVGYRLHPDAWGRGIATHTAGAMAAYLHGVVGINRVQAFVMPGNVASQRVLEKSGFTREGLLRQCQYWKGRGVVDLVVFSMLRGEAALS